MTIYLVFAVLLFVAELFYFKTAEHFNITDKPNRRSSHTGVILRGGGIVFYIGALLYFVCSGFMYPWFFLGLTLISSISFIDDVRSVSQGLRLAVHAAAMLLMFHEWGLFTEQTWWLTFAALFVCTGIINAYNFMDGINGITGGYSLVIVVVLAFVNARIVPFVDGEMLGVTTVSLLVFCFFNFRKRAKCFAGDIGSVSIAFLVLYFIGRLMLVTRDFSWIMLLSVYGVDSVLTILHRVMLHENLGLPHRKHAYQIMANEIKMPHVLVSTIYMILQAVIAVGLICSPCRWMYAVLVLALLSIVYVVFMKKYYHLHEIYIEEIKKDTVKA